MEAQRTSGNYADSQSWEWGVDRYLNPDLSHLKHTCSLTFSLAGWQFVFVAWRRGDTMEIGVIGSVRGPLFSLLEDILSLGEPQDSSLGQSLAWGSQLLLVH